MATARKTQSGKAQSGKAQSGGARSTGSARGSQAKTTSPAAESDSSATTVHLPYVTAEFHRPEMPEIHVPDRTEISGALETVRENMPSREQMAYFAGLGMLVGFSVIEWPVAAAIGVGTVVAQRAAGGSSSGSDTSRGQDRSRSGSASA
ncbi:hypothetical protein [Haloactinomyces albus]|uniref:Uncharacterized protein n=1 Tax=Haloactinomyces albus TaxID=1352928 RepID=A0AAE4CP67_9ACTN|nr:hypothetical protein [Haloactinomyces albus]MDR7304121.1 hypothetical protein [Haloactinomyces albus]